MDLNKTQYRLGIPEHLRSCAVELYDEAFGQKLSVAISDKRDRLKIFGKGMQLEFVIGALLQDKLLGMVGIQTNHGSLTGGVSYSDIISRLGILRGNKAAAVLSLYDRTSEPGELLMDGIAVASEVRGKGVGGQLLDEVLAYAKLHGYQRVRLDVIDTNEAAKRLYERKGFIVTKTEKFEMLRGLLGFGGSATMVYEIC